MTKGSFYYHFRGIDEFVQAFADYHEAALADLLGRIVAPADPLHRMSLAVNAYARMPHRTEAAIRAWSKTNPVIAASQRRLDRACINIATALATHFMDGDRDRGHLFAHQLLALMAGLLVIERGEGSPSEVTILAGFVENACNLRATFTVVDGQSLVRFAYPDSTR